MLTACLESIKRQGATIIVVDNDPESHTLPALPPNAILVQAPERGIAQARNAGLRAAIENGYRWLAFIDDDGVANPDWLACLKKAQEQTSASVISGPQFYNFPSETPQWRKRANWNAKYKPEYTSLVVAATNNLLVDLLFIRDNNITFNERETANGGGGEDILFTWAITEAGGTLKWTNRAVVVETVPQERTTLKWYAKQSCHMGLHKVRTAKLITGGRFNSGRYRNKAWRRILEGIVRLIVCPPAFMIGYGHILLFSGIRKICEGRGMFAGLRGQCSNHYMNTTGG